MTQLSPDTRMAIEGVRRFMLFEDDPSACFRKDGQGLWHILMILAVWCVLVGFVVILGVNSFMNFLGSMSFFQSVFLFIQFCAQSAIFYALFPILLAAICRNTPRENQVFLCVTATYWVTLVMSFAVFFLVLISMGIASVITVLEPLLIVVALFALIYPLVILFRVFRQTLGVGFQGALGTFLLLMVAPSVLTGLVTAFVALVS